MNDRNRCISMHTIGLVIEELMGDKFKSMYRHSDYESSKISLDGSFEPGKEISISFRCQSCSAVDTLGVPRGAFAPPQLFSETIAFCSKTMAMLHGLF